MKNAVACVVVLCIAATLCCVTTNTQSPVDAKIKKGKLTKSKVDNASKSAIEVAKNGQLPSIVRDICEFFQQDSVDGHVQVQEHGNNEVLKDVTLCTSEVFDFTYIRNVGKLGGTYVHKSYLIPVLCKILPEVTSTTLSESQTTLFGGTLVSSDCERKLSQKRWLKCGTFNLLDDPTPVLGRSLIFTAVRNPYMRAVSIYKYIVERYASSSNDILHKNTMNFTECFGGYHESLDICLAKKNAGNFHWKEQATELRAICSIMQGQQLQQQQKQQTDTTITSNNRIIGIPTEKLVDGLDQVIEQLNKNNLPQFIKQQGRNLPLPSKFSGLSKVNAVQYDNDEESRTSWLHYFEKCGHRCLKAIQEIYFPNDAMMLSNLYGDVNTTSDLPISY